MIKTVCLMMQKIGLFALSLSMLLLMAPLSASAQSGGCLSQGEIQQAVSSGQIASLAEVLSRNSLKPADIVGQVSVCGNGGNLQYSIPVMQNGEARTLSVRASK